MAVIVRHAETGDRYILLGTGYGAYRATRPSLFFGALAPVEEEGKLEVAAICASDGRIGWAYSQQLVVVEVDGKPPAEVLKGAPGG